MVGRAKGAPRRKRGLPATYGAKKKQTTAEKKKHVRELAKASKWSEIEKLYGKKILLKAKAYGEKNRVVKTPQEIALEILLKNGYHPSAPQAPATNTGTSAGKRPAGSRTRLDTPAFVSPVPAVKGVRDSNEALTKEQQERIEKRRQEALERRKCAQQAASFPRPPPAAVIPYHPTETAPSLSRQPPSAQAASVPQRQRLSPSRHTQTRPVSSTVQLSNERHRIVTPEHHVVTGPRVENKQLRPEYFWDDLEAAAEIVQWEKDNIAEAALQQPTAKAGQRPFGGFIAGQNVVELESERQEIRPGRHRATGIPSLSQELAAAAEIVQWELEHEGSAEISAANVDSDPELEAPQYQLLPAPLTSSDFERHCPQKDTSACPRDRVPSTSCYTTTCSKNTKPRSKRPLTATPPALPGNAVAGNSTTSSGERRHPSSSSVPPQIQQDEMALFAEKHLLEDKLELPVLEFLDMMLA